MNPFKPSKTLAEDRLVKRNRRSMATEFNASFVGECQTRSGPCDKYLLNNESPTSAEWDRLRAQGFDLDYNECEFFVPHTHYHKRGVCPSYVTCSLVVNIVISLFFAVCFLAAGGWLHWMRDSFLVTGSD